MRGIAVGRKNWLFAGAEAGGRAAAAYTLIETAKLNKVDTQAWLTDVLVALPSTRSIASTNCCHGSIISRRRPEGAYLSSSGSLIDILGAKHRNRPR